MKIKLKWAALGIIIGLTFAGLWIKLDQNKSLESKIESYLEKYDRNPAGSPPASNRKFWDLIPKKVERINPDKTLSPLEVIRIGTLQECSYYSGEWISPIEQSIDKLLKESWTDQPNPQEISEKAAILSHCVETLKDDINPEINQRVKTKVKEELIKPLLAKWADERTETKTDTERKTERETNQPPLKNIEVLSPQYLANILTCGLIVEENLKNKAAIVISIINKLEEYKNQVDPSGYIPGGIREWNKEISHYILAIERILSATGGKVNLYNDNKIKKILEFPGAASFPTKDSDSPKYFPTFGNNTNPSGIEPILLDILSKRFESPPSIDKEYTPSELLSGALYSAYGNLQKVSIPIEPLTINRTGMLGFESKDKDLVVVFNNDKNMALSATSGNDNSKLEIGEGGAYTIFELGEDGSKWDFVTGSTDLIENNPDETIGWIPVPKIGGLTQKTNQEAKAKVTNSYTDDKFTYIEYDLLECYDHKGLKSISRSIRFDKRNNYMTVTDRFESEAQTTFESPILTENMPTKAGDIFALNTASGKYKIEIESSTPNYIWQRMGEKEDRNKGIETNIKLRSPQTKGFIKYRISKVDEEWKTQHPKTTIGRIRKGEALKIDTEKDKPGQFSLLQRSKNKWVTLVGGNNRVGTVEIEGITSTILGLKPETPALPCPMNFKDIEVLQETEFDLTDCYNYPVKEMRRRIKYAITGDLNILEYYDLAEAGDIIITVPTSLKIVKIDNLEVILEDTRSKKTYLLYAYPLGKVEGMHIGSKTTSNGVTILTISFSIDEPAAIGYRLTDKKTYDTLKKRAK